MMNRSRLIINWGLEIHTVGEAGGDAGLAGLVADLVEEGAAVPFDTDAEGAAEGDKEEVAEAGGEFGADADETVLAATPGDIGIGRQCKARDIDERAEEGDVSERKRYGIIGRQLTCKASFLFDQCAGRGGESARLEVHPALCEARLFTLEQMLDGGAQAESLLGQQARATIPVPWSVVMETVSARYTRLVEMGKAGKLKKKRIRLV